MLAKAASVAGGTADGAGEVISYTIDVTNDGNSAQADPVVSDPSVSDLAAVLNLAAPVLSPELGGDGFYVGDTDQDGILDAGESWSFFNVGDLDQNGVEDSARRSSSATAATRVSTSTAMSATAASMSARPGITPPATR
jgi:uncharacterized repeat protein (TIGR01451 family)